MLIFVIGTIWADNLAGGGAQIIDMAPNLAWFIGKFWKIVVYRGLECDEWVGEVMGFQIRVKSL